MVEVSTALYTALFSSLFAFIFGYFLGKEGWSGLETDVSDIKLDIANLKGKIDGPGTTLPTTGVTVTPVIRGNTVTPTTVL